MRYEGFLFQHSTFVELYEVSVTRYEGRVVRYEPIQSMFELNLKPKFWNVAA